VRCPTQRVRRLRMKVGTQTMQEIKHYRNVFPPLVLASKAIIQVNLTTPHMGNSQNPVYLSRSMDWDNPYVFFPISSIPRISPQFLVDCLVTYLGQSMRGEDGASLGEGAVRWIIGKKLLKYRCTTVDAGVVEEGRR
jgi:hypothetical protein